MLLLQEAAKLISSVDNVARETASTLRGVIFRYQASANIQLN